MYKLICATLFTLLFCISRIDTQETEIKDITEASESTPAAEVTQVTEVIVKDIKNLTVIPSTVNESNGNSLIIRGYRFISKRVWKILNAGKVNEVMRNIGTCFVNGAMELFTFYLPPAFLPLIATAAGMLIPFEPVVMLKQRMPVTTYRRAFNTAVNTFLSTFDQYKMEDDYDPYMTRRFNRRFMNDDSNKKN